jgi:hypothetical protein
MYVAEERASRIAFSGIFDGSLNSGRPLESGSGAGGQLDLGERERESLPTLATKRLRRSHDVPLPHDLPPAFY